MLSEKGFLRLRQQREDPSGSINCKRHARTNNTTKLIFCETLILS